MYLFFVFFKQNCHLSNNMICFIASIQFRHRFLQEMIFSIGIQNASLVSKGQLYRQIICGISSLAVVVTSCLFFPVRVFYMPVLIYPRSSVGLSLMCILVTDHWRKGIHLWSIYLVCFLKGFVNLMTLFPDGGIFTMHVDFFADVVSVCHEQ